MVTAPPPLNPFPDTSSFVNGGLFWREDESLKKYLQNANVVTYDMKAPAGGRVLPVYFRLPEVELRKRDFPYLIIDRLGWEREADREHRGRLYLWADNPYQPDGTPAKPIGTSGVVRARIRGPVGAIPTFDAIASQLPIPISIRYQVSAWARYKEQILWVENQMVTVLPIRFGAINMTSSSHARDDMSVRRMDFLGTVPLETTDPAPGSNASKRIFGRSWTVAISSEIMPSDLQALVDARVKEVVIDPSDRPGYDSLVGE